jgi:hypothetical protein
MLLESTLKRSYWQETAEEAIWFVNSLQSHSETLAILMTIQAACLAIRARNEGLTGIVAQSLVFPVTCHPKFFSQVPDKDNYELLSYVQNARAGIVDSYRMEFFWDCYLGTDAKPDPKHSPLLYHTDELKSLPPARKRLQLLRVYVSQLTMLQ